MAAEPRVIRGACPHDCPDTCAWEVTVRDGVAEKLVGVKEHPFTRGALCAKVSHFLERTYSPDRLLHPLVRTGPKGEGAFERVSWDDALAHIADRLTAIVAEHGGEAVLPYSFAGTQGIVQKDSLSRRFFARLGASRLERSICGQTVFAAQLRGRGHVGRPAPRGPRPQPLHRAVGDEHDRHQPAPVADRAGGAQGRRAHRRRRPAAHADGGGGRLARAPAPGHRRGARPRPHARDRGRGPPRRRVRRRAHRGVRAPRGRARGVDARAHAGGDRRAGRGGRRARARLRHHAPRGHPLAHRHRAPSRGRADDPHDRLPARPRGRVARPRRRLHGPDVVGGRARRSTRRPSRGRRPTRGGSTWCASGMR